MNLDADVADPTSDAHGDIPRTVNACRSNTDSDPPSAAMTAAAVATATAASAVVWAVAMLMVGAASGSGMSPGVSELDIDVVSLASLQLLCAVQFNDSTLENCG
jgi:hypothetical protein